MSLKALSIESLNHHFGELQVLNEINLTLNPGDYSILLGLNGAGKTTLIKALVKALGSDDSVSSPTFSLINEYKNQDGDTIYHLDLYRLKEENEAYDIGIEEILDSRSLKFIEWPQKINNLIDNNVHSAKISSINEAKRKLEFI